MMESKRLFFLDGIRGWAALVVLLSHIIPCFLGKVVISFDSFWLSFITNGRFAVVLFFIVSGYALSVSHLNNPDKIRISTLARLPRLAFPILIVSLITALLMSCGLMFNLQAAEQDSRLQDWLGTFYTFNPSLFDASLFSIYGTFFTYDPKLTYNSSLWTMPIEIIGSLLIYGYIAIFKDKLKKLAILLPTFLILFFSNPFLSCFTLGLILATLINNNPTYRHRSLFFNLIFIAIFIFLSIPQSTTNKLISSDQILVLLGFIFIYSIKNSSYLFSFFSNRMSRYLGKISFLVYLVQIPIICSWSSFLLIMFTEYGRPNWMISIAIIISTILLTIGAANLLLPIEKIAITRSKELSLYLLK